MNTSQENSYRLDWVGSKNAIAKFTICSAGLQFYLCNDSTHTAVFQYVQRQLTEMLPTCVFDKSVLKTQKADSLTL